jgi:hypothetical protein
MTPDSAPLVLYRWWITDERTGKRRRTTYKLTREQAARQWTDAEPDLSSREVRQVDPRGEIYGNSRPPKA